MIFMGVFWGGKYGVNGKNGVNGNDGMNGKEKHSKNFIAFLSTPLALWRGVGGEAFYSLFFIFASLSSIMRLISSLSV
jgi:hypothetical protein